MFSRKSSVATVGHSTHNLVFHQETRRHSAAPFSLATVLSAADKYQATDVPRHGNTPSTDELSMQGAGSAPYDEKFILRMGRKLHNIIPKGPPSDRRPSLVLRIDMKKEVHIVAEGSFEDTEGSPCDKEIPGKPPYLRMRPSEESIHKAPMENLRMPLTSTFPGDRKQRPLRRKPPPLFLAEAGYRTTIEIENEKHNGTESQHPLPVVKPARPIAPATSAQATGVAHHPANVSLAAIPIVSEPQGTPKFVPPPIPPRSPMRRRHASRLASLPSPKRSAVVVPVNHAYIHSLGRVFKSIFGSHGEKGKMIHNKKAAAFITRKSSLTRQTSKSAFLPAKVSYKPYSARVANSTLASKDRPIPPPKVVAAQASQSYRHKRKPSLPSFLPIE
ncbi:hypothetical protein M408DRAFT_250013 [Serendipita vermifera MAFF 305830]|uniref:Uncharacterized protein n=1 Tax=Serendipita vermifera MAFF 305830 TaxID=933852 RepID=A0A0C3AUQ4_SERVB|nr:hypothetical protein M408DRAFT_250013 [Serendipita vermifera MAFF 305830]